MLPKRSCQLLARWSATCPRPGLKRLIVRFFSSVPTDYLLCAGGAQISQVDEAFRRRQRGVKGARFGHHCDHLLQTVEIDLPVLGEHAALGFEKKFECLGGNRWR